MEKPILNKFGLTTEQYEIQKKLNGRIEIFIKVICYVVCFILGGLIFISQNDPTSPALMTYGFLIGGFFIGSVLAMALNYIAIRGVSLLHNSISPRFKAAKAFDIAKRTYDDWLARLQISFWVSLSGRNFEKELARLYNQLGYRVNLTPTSGDHGIDIEMAKGGERVIVQCKAYKKPVGPHIVRDLYGTLMNSKADKAILATTSTFTIGVKDFVIGKPIELVSISDIIRMQNSLNKES